MSPGGESGPGASARPSPARSRLLPPPLPHPHHEVELQPPEGNKEETPFSCISSAGPILLAVGPQSHRATLSPGRVCHQAACCLRRGQTADRGAGPQRVRAVPEFSPSLQGLGMQLVLGEKQGGEQRIHSAPPPIRPRDKLGRREPPACTPAPRARGSVLATRPLAWGPCHSSEPRTPVGHLPRGPEAQRAHRLAV